MSLSFIKKILTGDSKAVVQFYKAYSPRILTYLSKKLPHLEDAQEITNDVFLEAIDSLALLQKEENVSAWLYRIAHNKMVDFYRKKKIKSILLSQVPFLQIVANEIHQPEFQFEKDRIRDRIEKILLSLPKEYCKILKLRYEEGFSVKILAKKLNLSFKAAESLLFRARQSFKLAYERATIS
jgi:RNA polymerase sigma factor (sigma-70 family)